MKVYQAISCWCLLTLSSTSTIAAPLIFEGSLHVSDETVERDWTALRFVFTDSQEQPVWSKIVDRGVIELSLDEHGAFAAILDEGLLASGEEGALDGAAAARSRDVRIEMCLGLPCLAPVSLGGPRPLGAVPRALYAETVSPAAVREVIYPPTELRVTQRPEPGEFGSLPEALASLDGRPLVPDRPVTIRIERGIYVHDGPIEIRRFDGEALQIVGEGRDLTILRFPSSDGLHVTAGGRLGGIDQLTIQGGESEEQFRGVAVTGGAVLRLGPQSRIQQFSGVCLLAEASDAFAPGAQFVDCGLSGIAALNGARVQADDASVLDVGTYGLLAGYGGTLSCQRCRLEGGQRAIYAHFNAHIQAQYIELAPETYQSHLFRARYGGTIEAYTMRNPGRVEVDEHSFVRFME